MPFAGRCLQLRARTVPTRGIPAAKLSRVSTAKRLHSYDEYLALLERSEFKLEFCDGLIATLPSATPAHAALAASLIRIVGQALLGSCQVFTSDLKVRVEASGLSTFPDMSVVCGPQSTSPQDAHALTNPTLLVEVTSRSTEDYDRGDKLSHYKQIPSLKAVLFVSHRSRRVTVIERAASGWDEREHRAGERVVLHEPNLAFAVDDLYAGITLDPEP